MCMYIFMCSIHMYIYTYIYYIIHSCWCNVSEKNGMKPWNRESFRPTEGQDESRLWIPTSPAWPIFCSPRSGPRVSFCWILCSPSGGSQCAFQRFSSANANLYRGCDGHPRVANLEQKRCLVWCTLWCSCSLQREAKKQIQSWDDTVGRNVKTVCINYVGICLTDKIIHKEIHITTHITTTHIQTQNNNNPHTNTCNKTQSTTRNETHNETHNNNT